LTKNQIKRYLAFFFGLGITLIRVIIGYGILIKIPHWDYLIDIIIAILLLLSIIIYSDKKASNKRVFHFSIKVAIFTIITNNVFLAIIGRDFTNTDYLLLKLIVAINILAIAAVIAILYIFYRKIKAVSE
jgi:putative flippase GtrA